MSTKETDRDDAPLTRGDLKELAAELVTEFKRDEVKERIAAQKARFREDQRARVAAANAAKEAAQQNCPHLRCDNTSCVAWMQNSDGVVRGVCQHCNKLFSPESDPEEYERMRRVATLNVLQAAAQGALTPRSDTVRK